MLERLRQRMVTSAMGRNLAVDLMAAHGPAAAERLDALIAQPRGCEYELNVLLKARDELNRLGYH